MKWNEKENGNDSKLKPILMFQKDQNNHYLWEK
jgi:hypothetical protein